MHRAIQQQQRNSRHNSSSKSPDGICSAPPSSGGGVRIARLIMELSYQTCPALYRALHGLPLAVSRSAVTAKELCAIASVGVGVDGATQDVVGVYL